MELATQTSLRWLILGLFKMDRNSLWMSRTRSSVCPTIKDLTGPDPLCHPELGFMGTWS